MFEKLIHGRALLVALIIAQIKNLAKKDHGLTPWIYLFSRIPPDGLFQQAQEEFFKGVSKNASLRTSKNFSRKLSHAVDCNFIVNLQVKHTTLQKLYSKTAFSWDIFRIFEKATLLSDISHFRGIFRTQSNIYDGAFWRE